jgi:hypothetical protein
VWQGERTPGHLCYEKRQGGRSLQQQQPPGRVAVMNFVGLESQESQARLRRPRNEVRTCQALTNLNQPGYRERGTAVPSTPEASPSFGDKAWRRSVASAGTAGREGARGTAPRYARTPDARLAGRVRRHRRNVQRWQAPRAWRDSCASATVVIVLEKDSGSPGKSQTYYFHRFQYKQ